MENLMSKLKKKKLQNNEAFQEHNEYISDSLTKRFISLVYEIKPLLKYVTNLKTVTVANSGIIGT